MRRRHNCDSRRSKVIAKRQLLVQSLESRRMLAAIPLITEFVASNSGGLDDEDGNSSDWIEIYNAGDTPQPLDG